MAKLIKALDAALANMERVTHDIRDLYTRYHSPGISDEAAAKLVAEIAAAGMELALLNTAMFMIRDQINAGGAVIDTTATVKAHSEGLN